MESNDQLNNFEALTNEIIRIQLVIAELSKVYEEKHEQKTKLKTIENAYALIVQSFFDLIQNQDQYNPQLISTLRSDNVNNLGHLERFLLDCIRDSLLCKDPLMHELAQTMCQVGIFNDFQIEELQTRMRIKGMIPQLQEEEAKVIDFSNVRPIPERLPGQVHESRRMEQYEAQQIEEAKKNNPKEDQEWIKKLNDEIDMLFNILTPQQEEMDRIKKAYEEFQIVVDKVMKKRQFQYELVIYGSSANGLALRSNNSDLDLSLVIYNLPQFVKNSEKSDFYDSLLMQIYYQIDSDRKTAELFHKDPVITAAFGKQLTVRYIPFEVTIEVFINKVVDPYNTWLLQTYALIDERFLKLALVLKYWNKEVNKDRGKSKLNSYSMILMLIAYLQHQNVLPSLQSIGNVQQKLVHYDKFSYESKVLKDITQCQADVYFEADLETVMKQFGGKQNVVLTAAELLHGFFNFYYEKFETKKHVISISHSHPFLSKNEYGNQLRRIFKDESHAYILKKMLKQMNFWAFTIVDPFDRTYNPSKQVTLMTEEDKLTSYQRKFKHQALIIEKYGSLQLPIEKLND